MPSERSGSRRKVNSPYFLPYIKGHIQSVRDASLRLPEHS
jgi:hypothetical protein